MSTSKPPTSSSVITEDPTTRSTTKETPGVTNPTSSGPLLPGTTPSNSSKVPGPPATSTSTRGVPYGPSNNPDSRGQSQPSGGTSSQSSNIGMILGGVAGILIVVLIIGFFVYRRRRRQGLLITEHAGSEEKAPPRDPEFLGDELTGERSKLGSNPQVPHEDDTGLKALAISSKDAQSVTHGSPQDHTSFSSPRTSFLSTLGGESPYALGSYVPYSVNGPHKIITGSRASSILHGSKEAKFLRDTELYHDDGRSWMSKRSRATRDNSVTSGAYVAPMVFQRYNEDEGGEEEEYQIPLVEQVAFVRSQQQDLDRLRQEQQEWLERMEKILESGNPPVALDGSVAELRASARAEEDPDASTVGGDSGTVAVVVPPGFEVDIEATVDNS